MFSDKFIRRANDDMGTAIGVRNANPILDMRMYEIMFTYESLHQYSANIIDNNMYSHVDAEGYQY